MLWSDCRSPASERQRDPVVVHALLASGCLLAPNEHSCDSATRDEESSPPCCTLELQLQPDTHHYVLYVHTSASSITGYCLRYRTLLRINLSGSMTTFSAGPPTADKGFGAADAIAAAAAEVPAPDAACSDLMPAVLLGAAPAHIVPFSVSLAS